MIDFAERVEDVCLILQSEFGVSDRQLIEILLARQVIAPAPFPWIILETDCHSLDLETMWFNFGDGDAMALPRFRLLRPRLANADLAKLLRDTDCPQLFIEPQYHLPAPPHFRLSYWPYLMQSCLRVRSLYPKAKPPTEATLQKLQAAVNPALDERFRGAFPDLRASEIPSSFLYFAELAQRASPYLRDWNALVTNLQSLVRRLAYLYNRPVELSDWRAAYRVLGECVPVWTRKILEQFASTGQWQSLRGYYSEKLLQAEVRRLTEACLVWSHMGRWRLIDPEKQGKDLLDLVLVNVEL